MTTLILITLSIFIIYLIYPFWLIRASKKMPVINLNETEINGVSLIYLSHNGIDYLEGKLNFLFKELTVFDNFEIIIIDDNSIDGSKDVIRKINNENIRIIINDEQMGIPHSMNTGVRKAVNSIIVFCDQRQFITNGAIGKLIEPLINKNVGAVSACISHIDKTNKISPIRIYENFVKYQESRTGDLIGVYGPLYAIRKDSYCEIPNQIILDDLYLSLKMLRNKQVVFMNECVMIDDNAVLLYNYNRIKRYLRGLLQLIFQKELIGVLTGKQILMLFWHKYLKLCIPILLFLCYTFTGIMSFQSAAYLIVFIIINLIGALSLLSSYINNKYLTLSFIGVNILYVIALFELIFLFIYTKVVPDPVKK